MLDKERLLESWTYTEKYLNNNVVDKDKINELYNFCKDNEDNANCLYVLGFISSPVMKNENDYTAIDYIIKSANMENPSAISKLAFYYSVGHGVSKNIKKSIELYKKAIGRRHSESCLMLANMYMNGHYVNKNPSKAIKLLQKGLVFEPKNVKIIDNLGFIFYKGIFRIDASDSNSDNKYHDFQKAKFYFEKNYKLFKKNNNVFPSIWLKELADIYYCNPKSTKYIKRALKIYKSLYQNTELTMKINNLESLLVITLQKSKNESEN